MPTIRETVFGVIDTEGGLDPEKSDLLEIGMVYYDIRGLVDLRRGFQTYIHPTKPIPPDEMGVHHLTDRFFARLRNGETLLEDFQQISQSRDEAVQMFLSHIRPEVEAGTFVPVAHNAAHEAAFLGEVGPLNEWIDTQSLAKHLLPNALNFKNQTLRYSFPGGDELDTTGFPVHGAVGDALVTAFNLAHLIRLYCEAGGSRDDDIQKLIALSNKVALLTKCPLKKYKGKPWEEVPSDYMERILLQSDMGEDLKLTCRHHLAIRLNEEEMDRLSTEFSLFQKVHS